jgi:hypothetical protein
LEKEASLPALLASELNEGAGWRLLKVHRTNDLSKGGRKNNGVK